MKPGPHGKCSFTSPHRPTRQHPLGSVWYGGIAVFIVRSKSHCYSSGMRRFVRRFFFFSRRGKKLEGRSMADSAPLINLAHFGLRQTNWPEVVGQK